MSTATATSVPVPSGAGTPAGSTPGRAPKHSRFRPSQHNPDGMWPWAFVLPTLAGIGLFYIWPIIKTFYYSFTKWGAFGTSVQWVGGQNYATLIHDPTLGRTILNTVVYTLIVLLGIPISIFFAALINRPGLRFAKVYRVAFFMPYVAMPTAIAMVFRLIYNGDFGILNYVLSLFGIKGPHWTSTPGYALVAVGLMGLWSSLGFTMIILSAGLKSIPPDLYEAAQLDGASNWRQFRSITIPLLTPSIFFVSVMTIINGFQLFDLLYALMGQNNPAMQQTQSLVYMFYNQAFMLNNQGYAAAIAMLILLLVGTVTAFQFWMQRRWVNYV